MRCWRASTRAARQGSSPSDRAHSSFSRRCSHWWETVAALWKVNCRAVSTGTTLAGEEGQVPGPCVRTRFHRRTPLPPAAPRPRPGRRQSGPGVPHPGRTPPPGTVPRPTRPAAAGIPAGFVKQNVIYSKQITPSDLIFHNMEVIDAPMPPFPDRDGGWYDFAPGETCLKRLPGRGFLKGYPYFTPEKGGVTREISLQAQQKASVLRMLFLRMKKL